MSKPRVVIALGGNALQQNGEVTVETQKTVTNHIGEIIAKLSDRYEVIVTHGHGQQVGYWLTQAIDNAFLKNRQHKKAVSVVTQIVVDRNDPAFRHPTKPTGEFYDAKEAVRLTKLYGWEMREDAGRGWRRVVPSPKPIDIVERREIISMVQAGTVVIAVGGGGMPVVRTKVLKVLKSVDAVIDKDLAAAKLAELVKADIFVSVTDVPQAYLNFGQPDQIALGVITPREVTEYIKDGQFGAGSMLPKIQAASQFASKKRLGIITSPENLESSLKRRAGTIVQIQ